MTVTTIISGSTGIVRPTDTQNATVSLSQDPPKLSASLRDDIVTYPSQLQKQGASLRVVAQSVTRISSQLDAASLGANEITSLISQLQGIATQASLGGLTDSQRNLLNAEFQSLRQQINNVATDSDVDGVSLIVAGSKPKSDDASGSKLPTIGGLTSDDLFGKNSDINVTTSQAAQTAITQLVQAEQYVSNQATVISATQADFEQTAATVESALQNQEASRSTFGDSDFTHATSGTATASLQSQASNALFAQTSRLPSDILQLLAE